LARPGYCISFLKELVFPIKQQAVYSFREVVLDEITSCIDDSLFHHPEQLRLQSSENWHSFVLQTGTDNVAIIHVHVQDSIARSPFRSPYGSYLFSVEVPEVVLTEFSQYVENALKKLGVETIHLKNPAEAYHQKKSKRLFDVLINTGYTIEKEESSALIPVTAMAFEDGLHPSEKKRLRKCRDGGFVVQQVSLEHLDEVYRFLLACRQMKNYSLSMRWDEIRKLAEAFPDRFILMVVMHDEKMVAASISIRITSYVMYNFYHDHDAAYDLFSPVVLLNQGLYSICQQIGLSWLDLGTSQAGEVVKESLLTFKRRLGAIPSRKLTFVKNLK
jgi:hypothetical protein